MSDIAPMNKKQVFVGGTIDSYQKRLDYYAREKCTFEVRKYGLTRKITFPDSKVTWKFFGTSGRKGKQFIDGSWFASMVRKEVDAYIEAGAVPQIIDKPDIQQFNLERIKMHIGKRVTAIDINACHWTTAHHLGIISDDCFSRGIKSGKKKGLLVAIGTLNKLEQVDVYEDGVIVDSYYDVEKRDRYSPFYWAVICRVRDVMMELYERFQDDFYMWLTDCAFVSPHRADEVRAFFDEKGYKHKQYDIDFKQVTPTKVVWFDPKAPHDKYVGYHGRDIQTQYILWQQMERLR